MKTSGAAENLRKAASRLGLFLFIVVVRVMPYPLYRVTAVAAMRIMYLFSGKLRRAARETLTAAFAGTMSDGDKDRVGKAAFFNLSLGIAEFIYSLYHPEHTTKAFEFEGRENLDRALAKGKGAVIAIAHFGPFVWMLLKFIEAGYRTNIVMRPPKDAYYHGRFPRVKTDNGLSLIYSVPMRACVVESVKALERGELVFMPVDQNYGASGRIFVDFFGRKAATAPGPALYAMKTGAPVFFAYALPAGQGRFRIIIEPEMTLKPQATERETLVHHMAVITSRVEDIARRYPEQWSWMHRRWKTVPREGEI